VRVSLAHGKPGLAGIHNDQLRLKITAAPVDGKANTQAIKLLAKQFGVAQKSVALQRGATSRTKLFRIAAPTSFPAGLLAKIDSAPPRNI
jgi:uncharacterized protein (TIGR00251 family)